MKTLTRSVFAVAALGLVAALAPFGVESTALAQVQPTAPAAAQVTAGDNLFRAGRYAEAAQQYEAAFGVDPNVAILQRLAQAYRLAGDTARYNATQQRIAVMSGNPPPDAPPPGAPPASAPPPSYAPPAYQPGYAQPVYQPGYAQPGYQPGYAQPGYAQPAYPPGYRAGYGRRMYLMRPGQRLINAGLGLLISGYAGAVAGGAITMTVNYECCGDSSWYGAGGSLFIPVAGPFVSLAFQRDPLWAVPWAVIDGGLQITGLVLIIAGAIVRSHYGRPVRRADAKPLPFSLSPYATTTTSGLSFTF